MNGLRYRTVIPGLVCAVGLASGRAVNAQATAAHSLAAGTTTGGVSAATGTSATTGMSAATGLPMMPIPMPFFAPSGSSGAGDPAASGGPAAQGNVFSNPYNAPFLYSSMLPGLQGQGQAQTGSLAGSTGSSTGSVGLGGAPIAWMMLATQRPLGIGSGQWSGARSGPGGSRRDARNPATARQAGGHPRTSPPPGGLAARYFNRTGPRAPYPQSYYNRQSRYFP